ncbi:AAA family ATPase [Bradyrhizobium septentrionale]|uniref:AAA family ATPase n=1 Tax=Bradyrhizobium septentrionale TaxID=1404411 RepID=A0A973W8X4_9BRAD|nr:AAA family ATPase [Bradyrhizobium septentrionale]UGY17929.1 AAA family ATPase [Bradyrhizobium septentrionale]
MTSLYLKRVSLRQFRSFAALDVELPAQPGVLIVHGSNGLGKSSLFDALEWALSDRIDHFRDANGVNKPGTYLCRWREGQPGPTSATMTFSDDSTITRSLLSAKSTKSQLAGNVADITAFLRAPAWQQGISELQRYLLLTHFLGQSTISRLTYRKSTERFDILKEAAQSTAIEAIANSLHGQGNNTVVRAYARRSDMAERDAKNLDVLLEQETTLWSESQISGAIDDASASIEALRIAEELTRAQVRDQSSRNILDVEIDPTIERLQAAADQIVRDCLAEEAQLEEGRRLFGERQQALADIAEITASRAATQTRFEELGTEYEQAVRARGVCRGDVATREEALAEATAAVSRLRALSDARALVARLTTEHRDTVSARMTAEQAKIAAERDVTLAERKRQILRRITVEIDQCDEELDRLRSNLTTMDRAIASDERIRHQSELLAKLNTVNPDIDMAVERAEAAVAAAIDSVRAQASVVEGLRNTVDAMSNAIASIAAHLPADACDCPVCATPFDSASALQARVSTAAQRLAPALLAQEEALRTLLADRDSRATQLQRLRTAQSDIRAASAALNSEREQRAQLLARLDGGSTEESTSLAAKRAQLADRIEALSTKRRRKTRWQTHRSLSGSSSDTEHSRAVRARDAAQRALDASLRSSAALAAALDRAKADETNASTAVDASRAIGLDELPLLLREAEATLRLVREALSGARRALAEADATVATLTAEQAGLLARFAEFDSRIGALNQTQRRISDGWRALQRYGSDPDLALVQAAERRLAASRLAVKQAAGRLARLRDGRLAWSRQINHRALLEQIRELVDGPPNGTREEWLTIATSLRDQREAEVEAIQEVKEIAKAASADITTELEGFNSEYIKPLGFLMSRINQAILCDPRVGIDLHVKKKKIEQSAVKNGEVPSAIGEIDPVLVHSEGQMAALAVSMLCAASLTFPWSRWKALVLDDPLQHNDSIHAAAFADLIGNLVSAEGYQILLSTHDVAQAEFLQRKFRSRFIPCTMLNLLGLGKDGVEWVVQSSTSIGSQIASA